MEEMEKRVFTPIKIGTVELKNRFQFAQPTTTQMIVQSCAAAGM